MGYNEPLAINNSCGALVTSTGMLGLELRALIRSQWLLRIRPHSPRYCAKDELYLGEVLQNPEQSIAMIQFSHLLTAEITRRQYDSQQRKSLSSQASTPLGLVTYESRVIKN